MLSATDAISSHRAEARPSTCPRARRARCKPTRCSAASSTARYAYRFGPPKHDVVAVRLVDPASGNTISEDFHFPVGLDLPMQREAPECRVERLSDGNVAVTVKSAVFLQSASIACAGWLPDDNYFHVVPGCEKRVVFRALAPEKSFRAELEALNLSETATLRADGTAS